MQQFQKQKEELLARKETLEQLTISEYGEEKELARSESFSTGELSQYDNHPADTATDFYERGKDIAINEHLRNEYEDILHALEKLDNGTYGICEVSGKPIPLERLEAYPTARTLVEYHNQELSQHRPIEEEVLDGFRKFNFDGEGDETQFDAEDAYQSVAEFNELPMVFEDSSLDENGELIGYVEELEGFLSTGIEGYTGADHVDFQRNVHYDQYLNGK
ncbi:TraR/DksA C4-type zinc finger protein [Halalkalibacter urbisdiaboli]|uniref:TraR/DksA C4-type zinc finger protein n=1 Tax=Halalkalibacter urbisdiaboli TaxID=1960589 RepID=UPI000B43F186|nr:TraR/DksA C4-type zinc finger protein [Halalkalibacter urbisdiaboli]